MTCEGALASLEQEPVFDLASYLVVRTSIGTVSMLEQARVRTQNVVSGESDGVKPGLEQAQVLPARAVQQGCAGTPPPCRTRRTTSASRLTPKRGRPRRGRRSPGVRRPCRVLKSHRRTVPVKHTSIWGHRPRPAVSCGQAVHSVVGDQDPLLESSLRRPSRRRRGSSRTRPR